MKASITKVEKPWGYELIWAKTDQYVGKILHVNKGHQLSLQYHKEKEETIYLAKGRMTFVFEETKGQPLVEIDLHEGECHHIPPNRQHRMIAVEDCDIFEVSTPQLHDVVRIDDSYGRTGK
ncbi:MAG: cupin domain-containing protein [Deltaproteobacteria bacterium]|nr:cupin domain-containing protein [Deltaproteobacteria bacterium]